MRSCLIVLDVQKGFITSSTSSAVKSIVTLIESGEFDHILATRVVNSRSRTGEKLLQWYGNNKKCSQELEEQILSYADVVISRSEVSCYNEELKTFLSEHKIDEVTIVGVDMESSLLRSISDICAEGYSCRVLLGSCASVLGGCYESAVGLVLKREFENVMVE